jgi:Zn-dependent protease with chaperone function
VTLLRWFVAAALAASAAAAQPATPPPPPKSHAEVQSYNLSAEKRAKAIEYARERNRLYFFGFAWGMAVIGGVLALRVAPRFRDWAERVTRIRFLQAYIFVPLLLLLLDLADLPLSMRYHHLAVKYEQSVQPWGSWFWDWTKGELISFAISGFLVWGLYGLIRRSPRRWWFYGWLAAVPLVVFLVFIEPVLLAPVFNKFEPLARRNAALVTEIGKVTARGGLDIPRDRMFLMLASEKVNSLNAYVTGVGASKRVVVWDTTIAKLNTSQILFVFGHEMGHYVLGHLWMGMAAACVGILAFLFVSYRLLHGVLAKWGLRWGVRSLDDWASLPVLILTMSVFTFISSPVSSAYSRMLEHNADIYGLEVIHGVVPDSSRVAAESFQILGEVGLSDPDPSPFIEFWMYDHPAIRDRVRFASQYDPWGKGETPKYVR